MQQDRRASATKEPRTKDKYNTTTAISKTSIESAKNKDAIMVAFQKDGKPKHYTGESKSKSISPTQEAIEFVIQNGGQPKLAKTGLND